MYRLGLLGPAIHAECKLAAPDHIYTCSTRHVSWGWDQLNAASHSSTLFHRLSHSFILLLLSTLHRQLHWDQALDQLHSATLPSAHSATPLCGAWHPLSYSWQGATQLHSSRPPHAGSATPWGFSTKRPASGLFTITSMVVLMLFIFLNPAFIPSTKAPPGRYMAR